MGVFSKSDAKGLQKFVERKTLPNDGHEDID